MPGIEAIAGGVGDVVGTVQQVLSSISKFVGELIGLVNEYVSKFDPGLFRTFTLSLDNLKSAIGKLIAPIAEFLIPVFDILNAVITAVADVVRKVVDAFRPFFRWLYDFAAWLLKIIGIDINNKTIAAQGAGTTLSFEALSRSLQEAALNVAQRDTMGEIADNTKRTADNTEPRTGGGGDFDVPLAPHQIAEQAVVGGFGGAMGFGGGGAQVKKKPFNFGAVVGAPARGGVGDPNRQLGGGAAGDKPNPFNIFDKRNWSKIVGGEAKNIWE